MKNPAAILLLIGALACTRSDASSEVRLARNSDSFQVLFYTHPATGISDPSRNEPTTVWSPQDDQDSIVVVASGLSGSENIHVKTALGIRHVFLDDAGPVGDNDAAYQPSWLQWNTLRLSVADIPEFRGGRRILVLEPARLDEEARRLGARSDQSVVAVRVRVELADGVAAESEIRLLPSL